VADKFDGLVRDLLAAFERLTPDNVEPVLAFFGPKSEFFPYGVNQPPLVGTEAMGKSFASVGNTVFSERVDNFTLDGEHHIALPVAGVGEVADDGKTFSSWRDYFDPTPLTSVLAHP
jgi:hypothetical protein